MKVIYMYVDSRGEGYDRYRMQEFVAVASIRSLEC